MRDFARTLFPALVSLFLLAMGPVGCGVVASLEPIYTEKDLVFDPAALGVWHYSKRDIYVHVVQAGEKDYRLTIIGEPGFLDDKELAVFKAHLVKLKDHLFLDLYPDSQSERIARLSGWYERSVLGAHQIALVRQLGPTPIVVFMDRDYWKEHPVTIRHTRLSEEKNAPILLTAPTKKVQRFLRKAVKHGAFDHRDRDFTWELTASMATALHFAAAQRDAKELEQLIEKGADVNARDEKGRTPLHWAGELGQTKAFSELMAAGSARYGSVGVAELLLAKGAQVNAADDAGTTPLHLAARHGDADLVRTLLDKGASVNAKDENGFTPLHYGAASGSVGVVGWLLAKGAEVNAKSKDGYTPLHAGAELGSVGVVELLLAKGAQVNAKSKDGYTPLHAGAASGSVGVVKLLLAKGADVNAKNVNGSTPIDLAKDPKIIELLKQYATKK